MYNKIQQYKELGFSKAQVARVLGINVKTVRKYWGVSPEEVVEMKNKKRKSKYTEYEGILLEWLQEDQQIWKKQRHTAARIHQRLVDEYQFKGSASNMRKVVARLKKTVQEVFIPLEFQLGQQFQFDWGEANVMLKGERRRIHLFCLQLSASRKRFVRAYLHEKQEAFLDGFVHGFQYFGGVPSKGLFDNLKSAVVKVLEGRERLEQETFQALQAHYLFKADFCNVEMKKDKSKAW